MRAVLFAAPAIEPVDLGEARDHLRVDAADDDDYISSLIVVARQDVEHLTRRAILTQTWDLFLDNWPSADSIKLPFGNLQSVTSIAWRDDEGTSTTLTAGTLTPTVTDGDYYVETNGEGCGRIVLPNNETWPSGTLLTTHPITIRFVCGWTSAANVPRPIRAAVLLTIAKLYESRGEDTVGVTVHEDQTVDRLLASYRLFDEF